VLVHDFLLSSFRCWFFSLDLTYGHDYGHGHASDRASDGGYDQVAFHATVLAHFFPPIPIPFGLVCFNQLAEEPSTAQLMQQHAGLQWMSEEAHRYNVETFKTSVGS
jgi:hypothetical protein